MRKTYFTLFKALALFFITSVLLACRSYVPTEKVTSFPSPPLGQQLPSSLALFSKEAPPAEDIPPWNLENRRTSRSLR